MRPRDKTAAEIAEVSRPREVRGFRAAMQNIAGADTEDWMKQMNVASLVNYATAPVGAKKFEGSSLSR